MQVHEDTVTFIRYVDGLQRLITASSDATIKIWTMEEGRGAWTMSINMPPAACIPDLQFLEHEGAVLSLDVQENNIVVSGDEDGGVIAWDLRNPCTGIWQQRGVLQGPVVGIRFIPNRPQLVIASGDGTTHLLDVRKGGSFVATYNCKKVLKCIETSGETILAGSANGDLFVCHADFDYGGSANNTLLSGGASLQDHDTAITSISMLRSNEACCDVATASDDGHIHLYKSWL
ncbi:hypothetical protein L7F22_035759 [Adiantum nelumboides]|nr:hypothetical protein [Adiantum nelumboides]